jgi:hypothetical protein
VLIVPTTRSHSLHRSVVLCSPPAVSKVSVMMHPSQSAPALSWGMIGN